MIFFMILILELRLLFFVFFSFDLNIFKMIDGIKGGLLVVFDFDGNIVFIFLFDNFMVIFMWYD